MKKQQFGISFKCPLSFSCQDISGAKTSDCPHYNACFSRYQELSCISEQRRWEVRRLLKKIFIYCVKFVLALFLETVSRSPRLTAWQSIGLKAIAGILIIQETIELAASFSDITFIEIGQYIFQVILNKVKSFNRR